MLQMYDIGKLSYQIIIFIVLFSTKFIIYLKELSYSIDKKKDLNRKKKIVYTNLIGWILIKTILHSIVRWISYMITLVVIFMFRIISMTFRVRLL